MPYSNFKRLSFERLAAVLPLAGLLAVSVLTGCHKDESADSAGAPAPSTAAPAPTPSGPTGPAGPGASAGGPAAGQTAVDKTAILVKNALVKDSKVGAKNLIVTHTNNTVNIAGTVKTKAAKAQATDDVMKVPGVRAVVNQLVVTP